MTLEAFVGTWRNESNVSGFMVWFEGGINIDVFWVFDFGASFKLEWDYLGPDPAYRRIGCEVKIHTPWWLPDATFDWHKTFDTPRLDQMSVVSTPVIASNGRALARQDAQTVAVSPIVGNAVDAEATYSTNDLAPVTGDWPAGALDAIEPIATDATVAVSFKATVDDRLAWGQNTPDGMGRSKATMCRRATRWLNSASGASRALVAALGALCSTRRRAVSMPVCWTCRPLNCLRALHRR